MSYVPVPLGLTHEHVRKLARGYGIRLTPAMMSGKGGYPVHMTRRQAAKAMRGKGMILRMSPAQIKHHMRGEGWFSSIVDAGKSLAKKYAPALFDKAKSALSNGANSLIDKYAPSSVRDIAKKGASYGLDKLTDLAKSKVGGGIRRPRGGAGVMGAGAKRTRTGQVKRTPHHPVVTSFERDPLPGEHFAIPQ